MRRAAGTLVAGFRGALEGLLALAVACAIIAALPTVLTSLANRGTVDMSVVPRSMVAPSDSESAEIDGSPEEREAVRTALNDLVWPISSPMPRIVVTPAHDFPLNVSGTYEYPDNVIRVSREVVDDPARWQLSHVLAHELGHMLDMQYLDDAGRSEFLSLRGLNAQQDWKGDDLPWEQRPQEDFAEVFAALDAPASGAMISTDAGRIRDLNKMRALIERYEVGAQRASASPGVATLLGLARATAIDMSAEPNLPPIIFAFALVCATVGAVGAMRDAAYASRVRPSRASRHLRGVATPPPA